MINIAIDGHASSGKSELAHRLAESLGFCVFGTGSIYRSIACEYIKQGLPEPNESIINKFVKTLDISVHFEDDAEKVVVNDCDYTDKLRQEEVSVMASKVAKFQKIRDKVIFIQRDFAEKHNVVMEGRDIGTKILPNATFKFFVTAKAEVRAKRRFEQLKLNGTKEKLKDILNEIKQRDYDDEHREIAPLKRATDAILVDNSNLSREETLDFCLNIIKNSASYHNIQKIKENKNTADKE